MGLCDETPPPSCGKGASQPGCGQGRRPGRARGAREAGARGAGSPSRGRRTRGGGGVWRRALRAGLLRLVWKAGKAFPQGRCSHPAESGCCPHRAFPCGSFAQSFADPLESSAFFTATLLHFIHIHIGIRLAYDYFCLVSFHEKLPQKFFLYSLKLLVFWLKILMLALRLVPLFVVMRTTF